MYAVIKTGGKQYKVATGEKIKIEQIAADVGQEIVIDQVLAVGDGADLKVGTPLVEGASVKATVLAQGRHAKVRIFTGRISPRFRSARSTPELRSAPQVKELKHGTEKGRRFHSQRPRFAT